jgi:hypothetical protein
MKALLLILILCPFLLTVACIQQENPGPAEWVELFNGKDLEDWDIKIKGHPLNENFANTFRVEDGKLKVSYAQYEDWGERYGHIFHKQKFSAYLLLVEYRFTGEQIAGGAGWAYRNSGAMLHAQPAKIMKLEQDFPVSVEAQFLGGNGRDPRTTGNLCTPGTHVVIQEELYTPHCVNANSETYHNDRWVNFQALVLGDSIIKHIVEKDTVLVYEKPQIDGSDGLVDVSIYKDRQLLSDGFIALQSESHPIEFRKVMLFNLENYMDDPEGLRNVLKELKNRREHL